MNSDCTWLKSMRPLHYFTDLTPVRDRPRSQRRPLLPGHAPGGDRAGREPLRGGHRAVCSRRDRPHRAQGPVAEPKESSFRIPSLFVVLLVASLARPSSFRIPIANIHQNSCSSAAIENFKMIFAMIYRLRSKFVNNAAHFVSLLRSGDGNPDLIRIPGSSIFDWERR